VTELKVSAFFDSGVRGKLTPSKGSRGNLKLAFCRRLCHPGNYFLEGTYYPATVDRVSEDGNQITVVYDDDGSTETLTKVNVRLIIPPTATQTDLGGPLSDEEAFGENSDDKITIDAYQIKAELAELIAKTGDKVGASALFEEASSEAMKAGKMRTATEWSLKASELLE
jgi:hypothetical protein